MEREFIVAISIDGKGSLTSLSMLKLQNKPLKKIEQDLKNDEVIMVVADRALV